MCFSLLNLACGFYGHILGQLREVFGGMCCSSAGGTTAGGSVVSIW